VIISEIGRGGMGIVYRAHDVKLGRVVALKRPRPEVMALPDFARRFLREARTASKLLHPHITTVFAAYERDGVPWLVMELVEGESLRARLASGRPLPCNEVIEHGEGLADALQAAHAQGILHADVNPNNILIGRDGRARLTDFGLARARNAPGAAPSFAVGEVPTWSMPEAAGTRGYMSPEHLRGQPLDPRSDIYCLGLVLYEMCVGSPAFAGKNTVEWVGAALDGETERLTRLGPEVPPELARVIARATATKPARRYQSAGEMAADLRTLRRFRESGVEIAVAAAARARARATHGVLAAVLVLAGAGAVALVSWRSAGPPVLRSRPLTSAPGLEEQPAVSPDGRLLAYTSNESGNDDIWLADLGTGESRRLTGDHADERDPAWFPDGAAVAHTVIRGEVSSIWRLPVDGGRPQQLVALGEQPAVAPDGARLAFARRDASGYLRIVVASLSDPSQQRTLTGAGDGLEDHRHPSWSPDGRTIAYADARHLWLVPAEGGRPVQLTRDPPGNREPSWSPDGRFVYFSSVREGPQALWRIPATGGAPERLTQGTGPESQPSLSRDGRRMVYATRREEYDIEVREVRTRRTWRISSSAYDGMPAVSPDGRLVAFISNRLGSYDLWAQRFDAAGPEDPARRLTSLPGNVAMPVFTPDGRWIAFHRTVNAEKDIWMIPADGGAARRLTDHPARDVQPAFAPDSSRVVFVSDRSGREELWLCALAGDRLAGEPRQLTSGSGASYGPDWSPDGSRIVFVRTEGDDTEAWVMDAAGAVPPRQVSFGARVAWVRWGPSRDHVYAAGWWAGGDLELRRLDAATGEAAALDPPVAFGGSGAQNDFSFSADGGVLAFTVTTVVGDIWLTEDAAVRR
jgi:Tol biopolymer transport system component